MQEIENLSDSFSSFEKYDFGGFEPFVDEFVIGAFLRITPRRVLEMARAGEIPAHPLGKGTRMTWRFRVSEISRHFATPRKIARGRMQAAVPDTQERKYIG